MSEGLRDEGFADADGPVEDDRLASGEEAEGGEISDLGAFFAMAIARAFRRTRAPVPVIRRSPR